MTRRFKPHLWSLIFLGLTLLSVVTWKRSTTVWRNFNLEGPVGYLGIYSEESLISIQGQTVRHGQPWGFYTETSTADPAPLTFPRFIFEFNSGNQSVAVTLPYWLLTLILALVGGLTAGIEKRRIRKAKVINEK